MIASSLLIVTPNILYVSARGGGGLSRWKMSESPNLIVVLDADIVHLGALPALTFSSV